MSARSGLIGSATSRMTASDLQVYENYAKTVSISGQIKAYNKEIKRLRRKVRRAHSDLRAFLIEEGGVGRFVNVDDDPTLASISLSDSVANDGPLSLIDDASNKAFFERNSVDPTFDGLLTIQRDLTEEKRTELEGLTYTIRKTYLHIRELEYYIGKLYNMQADQESSISEEEAEVEISKLQSAKRYNTYVHKFYAVFQEITSNTTTPEELERYQSYMQQNSVTYVYYKNKILNKFEDLPDELKGDPRVKIFKAFVADLAAQLKGFPVATLIVCRSNVVSITEAIQEYISDQGEVVAERDGVKNEFLDSMSSRVREILNSDSFSRLATDQELDALSDELSTERNTQERVRQTIEERLKTFNDNKNKIEAILSGTAPIEDSRWRRFFRNLAYRSGGIVTTDASTQKALEESLRTQIRMEYGGNIPFEDEEIVMNKDRKWVFVKKSELVRIRGEYRIASEVQAEAAARSESDPKDIN
jgi:hypothetical protein